SIPAPSPVRSSAARCTKARKRQSQTDAVAQARTHSGHAGRSPVSTVIRGRACPGHFFSVVPASVLHSSTFATHTCNLINLSHLTEVNETLDFITIRPSESMTG